MQIISSAKKRNLSKTSMIAGGKRKSEQPTKQICVNSHSALILLYFFQSPTYPTLLALSSQNAFSLQHLVVRILRFIW